MGINNTSNTGNSGLLTVGKQVTPNVSVTIPAYTATGWTAGDYLYQTTAGIVTPPSGIVGIGGPIVTLQATNVTVSGGLFNATQTLLNPNRTGATYTGPTVSPNSSIFATEVSPTTSATAGRCVALINGNVVIAYYDTAATTPGYYYAIYNSIGTVILAPTLVDAAASEVNIIPVALADGTFCIGYFITATNQFYSKRYSAAGVLISTAVFGVGVPPGQRRCIRAIQLVGGNIVYAWRGAGSPYNYAILNSSNTFIMQTQPNTSYFSTSTSQYSFGLYPFTSAQTGVPNGFGMVCWSDNQGTASYGSFTANGSGVTYGNTSGSWTYYSQDLCQLQDGTYIWVGSNSGSSLNATKPTFSTNGVPSTSGSTNFAGNFNPNYAITVSPYLGSGFFVMYFSDTTEIRYVRSTTTTSSLSGVSTDAVINYGYYTSGFGATCSTSGSIFYSISYGNSTTYLGAYSSQSAVNGTVYTATALTPPNYVFVGIAESTVPAGDVGNIIVGGNAIANSSMPNVSGTLYFDSTQVATFGNKGFVTGRNFTLKGFE